MLKARFHSCCVRPRSSPSRLRSSDSWGEFGAVKPPLEVCRARVAEVERAGAERVRRQGRPIHEFGGSFHDDHLKAPAILNPNRLETTPTLLRDGATGHGCCT